MQARTTTARGAVAALLGVIVTVSLLSSELVGVARAECFIGKAIADTELCSNTFQGMFEKKDDSGKERKFNATNPADLREACCSMERLERCLQAASTDAGCRDEVRFIVEHMTTTARRLIHSLYKIQCNKVDCSSAATRTVGQASWSLLALSSFAIVLHATVQRLLVAFR